MTSVGYRGKFTMAEAKEPDFLAKVIIVGDSGVGKTNLLSQFVRANFAPDARTTIGVEFSTKTIEVKGKIVKAQIWDTAGQERYRAVTTAYYRGSGGALVVYDITNSISFDNVERWLQELRQNADPGIVVMIVGNKSDLKQQRSVATNEGIQLAQREGCLFLETSALQNENVSEAFEGLVERVVETQAMTHVEPSESQGRGISVRQKEGGCC